MSYQTIRLTKSLPDLLDQLLATPKESTIVLTMVATTLPSMLFHYTPPVVNSSLPASSSNNNNNNSHCINSFASALSTTPTTNNLVSHLSATSQLVGKICELLYFHPAGSIAVIETNYNNSSKQQQQQEEVSYYCSGPELAFACACAYRFLPRTTTTKNKINNNISFWFGDVCASSITPYGGLTHTLREWFGASLSVPMLIEGVVVPATKCFSSRGGSNYDWIHQVQFNSNETEKNKNKNISNLTTIKIENLLSPKNSENWKRIINPKNRLQTSYGSIFSGVAWLRARRANRIQNAIVTATHGRKGKAEVAALGLIVNLRSVPPTQKKQQQQVGITSQSPSSSSEKKESSSTTTTKIILLEPLVAFKNLLEQEHVTFFQVVSNGLKDWYWDTPTFLNLSHCYFSDWNSTSFSSLNKNFAGFVKNTWSSSSATSTTVTSSSSPLSSNKFSSFQQQQCLDSCDAEELSLFLQRMYHHRGLPVKVFSLRQALNALTFESGNQQQKNFSGNNTNNYQNNNNYQNDQNDSSQQQQQQAFFFILLWDTPLYADSNPDLSTAEKTVSEKRSRFFLPEVCWIDNASSSSSSINNDKSSAGNHLEAQKAHTLKSVLDCLRQSSSRMTPPVIQRVENHYQGRTLLGKFQGLRIFSEAVKQAMLLVEDGTYPIVIHKAQQHYGITPTIFDRLDRDGDVISALELVCANISSASKNSNSNNFNNSSSTAAFDARRRRTGTILLKSMVQASQQKGDSRFSHFIRSGNNDIVRLDDVPLHKMILQISEHETKSRPRRIVWHEEIVLRHLYCGAVASFSSSSSSNTNTMSRANTDRLAGAVLGIPAFRGSTPLRNFAYRQKYSLLTSEKKMSKMQKIALSYAGANNNNNNNALSSSFKKKNNAENPFEFTSQLIRLGETLGKETIDSPPANLITALKSLGGNETNKMSRSKL